MKGFSACSGRGFSRVRNYSKHGYQIGWRHSIIHTVLACVNGQHACAQLHMFASGYFLFPVIFFLTLDGGLLIMLNKRLAI